MDVPGAITISGRSREVRERLKAFRTGLPKTDDTISTRKAIEDAIDRFVLWGGNVGAFRPSSSRLSLDSRLSEADAMNIRQEILRQLDCIEGGIEELMDVLHASATPALPDLDEEEYEDNADVVDATDESPVEDEEEPFDETSVLLDIISQSVSSLLRLGILIRKASPRDKFKEAQRATRLPFPDRYDIDYVRLKYPKLSEVQCTRLGRVIAKRRQFIAYCRDHKARLAHDETANDTKGEPSAEPTATEVLSSKASTFHAPQEQHFQEEAQGDVMSAMTSSTVSDSSMARKLPSLASLSPDDEPFECPICFSLQSFTSDRAWQRHAFRDLKAYMCTQGDLLCSDGLFGDRQSWFEHEMSNHWVVYQCALCDNTSGSASIFQSHIVHCHGKLSEPQLKALEAEARAPKQSFMTHHCPFCDDWAAALYARHNQRGKSSMGDTPHFSVSAQRFKRHVARHLEELAIFAMPRHLDNDDGSDSISSRSTVLDDGLGEQFEGGLENRISSESSDGDGLAHDAPAGIEAPVSGPNSDGESSHGSRVARLPQSGEDDSKDFLRRPQPGPSDTGDYMSIIAEDDYWRETEAVEEDTNPGWPQSGEHDTKDFLRRPQPGDTGDYMSIVAEDDYWRETEAVEEDTNPGWPQSREHDTKDFLRRPQPGDTGDYMSIVAQDGDDWYETKVVEEGNNPRHSPTIDESNDAIERRKMLAAGALWLSEAERLAGLRTKVWKFDAEIEMAEKELEEARERFKGKAQGDSSSGAGDKVSDEGDPIETTERIYKAEQRLRLLHLDREVAEKDVKLLQRKFETWKPHEEVMAGTVRAGPEESSTRPSLTDGGGVR